MGATLQALENIVNQVATISHSEINTLREAVENVKTTLTNGNVSLDIFDNKVSDQANRVRQLDGLFRILQSKGDQYAEENQRVKRRF